MYCLQLKTGLVFKTSKDWAFNNKNSMVEKIVSKTDAEDYSYGGKPSGMIEYNGQSKGVKEFSCNPSDIVAIWEDNS